jgi:hypothetical protein
MDKPDPYHPIGFIDTIAPEKTHITASYQVSQIALHTVPNLEGFKEHIVKDLAYQIALLIEKQMDVFWSSLDNGDQRVEANVRILNEGQWRDLEAQLFSKSYEYKKESYTQAWLSKQKWSQIPYGSMLRANPIVSVHCN